uniref:Uncharacterized protein n=1 Tax=Cucumis melo TaxID=3656 RepID=A0A1S3BEJ6_CUCME
MKHNPLQILFLDQMKENKILRKLIKEIEINLSGTISGKITEEDEIAMVIMVEERNFGTIQNHNVKCNGFGHTAMKCYSLYDPNFQRQFINTPAPNQTNFGQRFNHFNRQNTTGNNHFQAYMASTSQSNNTNGWYPDTGASNHVTNDLANLSLGTNYNGAEQVHVGDGTV